MKPTDAWIGRAVYSADGKHLGEMAAIASDQVYADIGGFLGIGETRVLLSDDSIHAVTDDRIVLKLTEAEAKSLPGRRQGRRRAEVTAGVLNEKGPSV